MCTTGLSAGNTRPTCTLQRKAHPLHFPRNRAKTRTTIRSHFAGGLQSCGGLPGRAPASDELTARELCKFRLCHDQNLHFRQVLIMTSRATCSARALAPFAASHSLVESTRFALVACLRRPFAVCSRSVRGLFAVCSRSVRGLFAVCSRSVRLRRNLKRTANCKILAALSPN